MSKLRLLKLRDVQLPSGLDYLSNDLRLLDWRGYPLKYLPSNFQPDNLVKLKMSHSCLKQPWNGRMCLDKLKYVDLSYSPYITKNLDFTQVANIEKLSLEGCTNFVEIPSIEAIKRLTVLNLRGLKNLKVLPTGCWLKSLKTLILSCCSKLKNVSDVLASTECLIDLNLGGTCVKELPVAHLSNLQSIGLWYCKELTSLPSGICGLKRLRFLTVFGCSKLSELPENLGGLEGLEDIDLMDCKELTSLPSGICGLKRLKSLTVSGCSKLSELPENLGGCERLISLLADFTAITQPPSSLKELCRLSFRGCKGPVITSTPRNSLLSFRIRKERQDQKERQDPMDFELPALSGFRSLRFLDLRDCNFSEGFLPNDLGSLSSLRDLRLGGTNIVSLPASIRDLHRLRRLQLVDCKKLKTLPYLPTNIFTIIANGCTSLETLPDPAIFSIKKLKGSSFTNCHTLLKNRPSLLLELLRNYVKNEEACYIVVPGREIPKYFRYHQNNMGHYYVGIQVMPDWYQRLSGIFVCAVFEATTPSIDAKPYAAECYVMWDDVVVYSTVIKIGGGLQFQSDHLFLHYISSDPTFGGRDWVGEIRRRGAEEENDLKKNEIIFYFRKGPPEIVDIREQRCKLIAPLKYAVHMVYQYDEEWLPQHLSIQQSDYDYKKDTREQPNPKRFKGVVQWRDSELFESSIQHFVNLPGEWGYNYCFIDVNEELY